MTSLRYALLIIIVNVALNLVSNGLLEANSSVALAAVLTIVHVLIVLALFGAALWFGVVGIRQTNGGAMRGRGRAIGGIVLSSVLLVLSFGLTIAQVAAAFLS